MKKSIFLLTLFFCLIILGCNKTKEITQTKIEKVGSLTSGKLKGYDDRGITEKVEKTFTSEDGLCQIQKYPSYYNVILDYEKGTPAQVGKAYASALLKAAPNYEKEMEPFLYENIRFAFGYLNGNYDGLRARMNALFDSIKKEYQEEYISFAEEIAKGEKGFEENGKLSYEEAIVLNMVPEALRGTACSAISLWGEKTATGQNVMCRNLEWLLGSEKQMCYYHAVVHYKNGDKSLINITVLGLSNMLTAINTDGVFAAILDVGSNNESFDYQNKKCYTHELRYALENHKSAEATGEFMVANSNNFTYSHNIALADKNGSYCAEDAIEALQKKGKGYSILRKADTPIFEGLTWENPDSMCILNSFITKDNQDFYSGVEHNLVRFRKYNDWLKAKDKFTLAEIKEMLTQETLENNNVSSVHSENVFHTAIIDYATGEIQVAFTGPEGVLEKPDFINIGHY